MEGISAVARDRSSRTTFYRGSNGWITPILFGVIMALSVVVSLADPIRPRTGVRPVGQRPSRPLRQAQNQPVQPNQTVSETETTADDGFGPNSPSSRIQEAPSDLLPTHVTPAHPLVPALRMAYASRATLAEVRDYTAQFVKKEWVTDHYITHNMDMKFREQPFGVYLRFRDPHEGRQVLFVKGSNADQILVREKGLASLAGTIRLNPTDSLALSENRHPITEIGIRNMLGGIIRQWEAEGQFGEIDVGYYPDAKLGNYPVRVIRTTHPRRRRQFKYHITQLYLDEKTLFPVRVDQYDWPQVEGGKPMLVEQYMYSAVRTNQNLPAAEFAPRAYGM